MQQIVEAVEACSNRLGRTYRLDLGQGSRPAPTGSTFAMHADVLSELPQDFKHCVLSEVRERTERCERMRAAWMSWCMAIGQRIDGIDFDAVEAPFDQALEVVRAIRATRRNESDRACRDAYEEFKAQTEAQWVLLTEVLGVKVEEWDERWGRGDDPYPSADAQIRDLIDNSHLWVNRGAFFIGEDPASPTGSCHPWMTCDEYFKFRAVHDAFGHSAIGSGFDRHGEYAAWIVHCTMYTGAGRRAMSTEYRAVNTHLWLTGEPMPREHWGILLPEDLAIPAGFAR